MKNYSYKINFKFHVLITNGLFFSCRKYWLF